MSIDMNSTEIDEAKASMKKTAGVTSFTKTSKKKEDEHVDAAAAQAHNTRLDSKLSEVGTATPQPTARSIIPADRETRSRRIVLMFTPTEADFVQRAQKDFGAKYFSEWATMILIQAAERQLGERHID